MKLVVDASIGFKMIVPEIGSDRALSIREDSRIGIHELLAPDLYLIEIGNSLVAAARSGRIPVSDLPVVYAELMAYLPIIHQSLSLFPRAYSIASRIKVSVYDALYLALCERENCALLTSDVKLLSVATGFAVTSLDDI